MENCSSKVSAIIKLFENRCKKENAVRLNKPLSKSCTALSNSEWKHSRNVYENQEIIDNIEDRLKLYISRIEKYDNYAREAHISHHQELLQILIGLLSIDVNNSQGIIGKKKEVVKSIVTQFEKLDSKLPTIPSDHFDFTYKPYSSLQNTSQTSLGDSANASSPNVIVEDGYILGSVEKLKAIFTNKSSDQQVQSDRLKVNSNNFRKAHLAEDSFPINFHESVKTNGVLNDIQKMSDEKKDSTEALGLKDNSSDTMPQTNELNALPLVETRIFTKVDGNADTFITENPSSLKYFEADSHFRNHSTKDPNKAIELYLNSRCLDEISRNKNGMQNVSSLKRIFETTSTEILPEDQNITEAESRQEETFQEGMYPLMRTFGTKFAEELPADQNIGDCEYRQEESLHENVSALKRIFETKSTDELPQEYNITEADFRQEECFHDNMDPSVRTFETESTEELSEDQNITEADFRQEKYVHENMFLLVRKFETKYTEELQEDQNISEAESRHEKFVHENVSSLIKTIETKSTEELLENQDIAEDESSHEKSSHENVSALIRIFETESTEELPDEQKITAAESRQEEYFQEDDQLLEITEKLEDNNAMHKSGYNNEDEKAFISVEIQNGVSTTFRNNLQEEQTNIPVLRGQPDLVESTVDGYVFPVLEPVNDACSIS